MTALGVDLGTTNTKVVLGPVVLSEPTPRSGAGLVGVVSGLVRSAIDAAATVPEAVGIASQAESLFALDGSGRDLAGMLSWADVRSDAAVTEFAEQVGGDALFAATGVRPGPKPWLAVWLGLRREGSPLRAPGVRWAGVADLVHLSLTGVLRTDHTLAGRTMAYRLPAPGAALGRGFDEDLLAEAGLVADQVPVVGLPGDALSVVTPEAARATGLRAGTPVLVAGHDHQVAAWAAGVRRVSAVADSVGTAEALLTLTSGVTDRSPVGRAGMSLVRAIDGSTEAVLAGSPSSGAFLQWLADRETGGDVGALLELGGSEPGAAGTLPHPAPPDLAGPAFWLPYPRGRQCPAPDPDAGARLVCESTAPPGLLALEAVSYQAQWIAAVQAGFAGGAPAEVVVIGEPVRRSATWARTKATLAGCPVRLVTASEPVAAGAALLAAVRSGAASPESRLDSLVVEPWVGLAEEYRVRLGEFVAAATGRPLSPGPSAAAR